MKIFKLLGILISKSFVIFKSCNNSIPIRLLVDDRNTVSDIYKNIPIYSSKDIKINGDDIIKLLNIEPGSIIKSIISEIEFLDSKIDSLLTPLFEPIFLSH